MIRSQHTVLITGATSFVGCSLINRLLQDQRFHTIHCLVHNPENVDWLPENDRLKIFFADLRDHNEAREAFTGIQLVINIAPIFVAPHVVSLATELGIPSVLFISSARKYSRLYAAQAREIQRCEQAVEKSTLDYIILRPSMIYGDSRERTILPLTRYIRRYRVIPLPNKGDALLQPLLVNDLVNLICVLLDKETFGCGSYDLGGPQPIITRDLFRILAHETKVSFHPFLLPYWFSSLSRSLLNALPVRQRHIMQFLSFFEDRSVDIAPARHDLDFSPTDFVTGLRGYLGVSSSSPT